jgi:hypothetical protein
MGPEKKILSALLYSPTKKSLMHKLVDYQNSCCFCLHCGG